MGKSGNSEHKEKEQREVEEKIIDLLSKFEKILKEELSTAIDPDEFIELANSLEIVIDLRKKLESAQMPKEKSSS